MRIRVFCHPGSQTLWVKEWRERFGGGIHIELSFYEELALDLTKEEAKTIKAEIASWNFQTDITVILEGQEVLDYIRTHGFNNTSIWKYTDSTSGYMVPTKYGPIYIRPLSTMAEVEEIAAKDIKKLSGEVKMAEKHKSTEFL